jgi:hypothetical protein
MWHLRQNRPAGTGLPTGADAAAAPVSLPGILPGAPLVTRSITEVDFDRVDMGMTLEEVIALIGPGTELDYDTLPNLSFHSAGTEASTLARMGASHQVTHWYRWFDGTNSLYVGMSPVREGGTRVTVVCFWDKKGKPGLYLASNVAKAGPPERVARPDLRFPPAQSPGDPRKLIVGRWTPGRGTPDKGTPGKPIIIEFRADGTGTHYQDGHAYEGSYRFVDDKTIELTDLTFAPYRGTFKKLFIFYNADELRIHSENLTPNLAPLYRRIKESPGQSKREP